MSSLASRICNVLEKERARVYAAISHYPPPITACDEQFDYLLARREMISRQLARMRESRVGSRELLEELTTSDLIGSEAARELRALSDG